MFKHARPPGSQVITKYIHNTNERHSSPMYSKLQGVMKRNLVLSCVSKEQSHSTTTTSQSERDSDIYREREPHRSDRESHTG